MISPICGVEVVTDNKPTESVNIILLQLHRDDDKENHNIDKIFPKLHTAKNAGESFIRIGTQSSAMPNNSKDISCGRESTNGPNRRQFLQATALLSAGPLAGCTGVIGKPKGSGEFPSKDIKFIIPFSEGTSAGTYVRTLNPIWASELNDDTNIYVENVPGGQNVRGHNKIYNAEPNGYTVGYLHFPLVAKIQALKDVEYDVSKFTYLGQLQQASFLLWVAPDSKFSSFDDMLNNDSKVTFSAQSTGASGAIAVQLMKATTDLNAEIVPGYDGGPGSVSAVLKGEVDATVTSATLGLQYKKSDGLKPILSFASPDVLPSGVPDDVQSHKDYENLKGLADAVNVSRTIAAPPDLDDGIKSKLADSLWTAMQSKKYESKIKESDYSLQGRLNASDTAGIGSSTLKIMEEYKNVFKK